MKRTGYLVLAAFFIMLTGMAFITKNAMSMSNAIPKCTTLIELQKHVGERVEVQGVYHHPGNTRLDQVKLLLGDGNTVVIHTGDGKYPILSKVNTGKKLSLIAKFYDKNIPEVYAIESRTAAPVIVAIETVRVL